MNNYSNSYIFRSVYQIDMKFDRQLRLATETLWVVTHVVVKQFQDGGRPPYLSDKSSDFHEILHTAADFELEERHVIINKKKLHWTDSEFDRTYFSFAKKVVPYSRK